MKKSKIKYNELNIYIINSILTRPNSRILEQLNTLQSEFRLSTIQYYLSIITYLILKYDYNKSADKSSLNDSILPKKENELDLF